MYCLNVTFACSRVHMHMYVCIYIIYIYIYNIYIYICTYIIVDIPADANHKWNELAFVHNACICAMEILEMPQFAQVSYQEPKV